VTPTPGEAIDSWLEVTARDIDLPLGAELRSAPNTPKDVPPLLMAPACYHGICSGSGMVSGIAWPREGRTALYPTFELAEVLQAGDSAAPPHQEPQPRVDLCGPGGGQQDLVEAPLSIDGH
jgi:hypothetical protein